jgi:hypothetical protein
MSKSKWFEVEVRAFKTVVVEVREDEISDKEDWADVALRVAHEESFSFCNKVEAGNCEEIAACRLESAKLQADELFTKGLL